MHYKYCVIGNLSLRQKIMLTKLFRLDIPTIAMDMVNAKYQNINAKADKIIFFKSSTNSQTNEDEISNVTKELDFSTDRILIEGKDFNINDLPS